MSRRHRQLPYWQPPETAPDLEPEPREDALWGWTLAEIHDIARSAALWNRWLVSDFTIRMEAAFDGIIDEILAAERKPSRHDLQAAGKGAIQRGLLKDFCHTYGVADRDLTAGIASAPRFAAYWLGDHADRFDDRITEKIAVGQVMAAMSEKHARTLETLAAVPDLRSAAEAAGTTLSAFKFRVTEATRAFKARWYSPEAPPRRKGPRRKYSPSEWNESRKAPCGTWGAWERHRERGDQCEAPEACKAAWSAHERARKQAARERRRAAA